MSIQKYVIETVDISKCAECFIVELYIKFKYTV